MGSARRAGVGVGLLALCATAWLVVLWVAPDPGATAIGPTRRVSIGPAEAVDALATIPTREGAEGSVASSLEPATDLPVPEACHDLEVALASLAEELASDPLFVKQVWDPRCRGISRSLDPPCLDRLARAAEDELRPDGQRLAALSLLRAAPELPAGHDLTEGARRLLELAFDPSIPSPVEAAPPSAGSAIADVRNRRSSIARIAGACLASLGETADRARLVELLDDAERSGLAAEALASSRAPDVFDPLAARLADSGRDGATAARALLGLIASGGLPMPDPHLAVRLTASLMERWERASAGSEESWACESALARLDPAAAALRWGELLDQEQVQDVHLPRAAVALARCPGPEAATRLHELLASGREAIGLAAAEAIQRSPREDSSASSLEARAEGVLEKLTLTSADPAVRRRALLATRGSDPEQLLAMLGKVLESDPDLRVREGAVLRLEALGAAHPRARELLELVVVREPEPRVRRAAAQALGHPR